MNLEQATNVVVLLQASSLKYRHFGVWWWHVKAELRRHGIDRKQLVHMGDCDEPGTREDWYTGKTVDELDDAAFREQLENATLQPYSDCSRLPDGAPYYILDRDVE